MFVMRLRLCGNESNGGALEKIKGLFGRGVRVSDSVENQTYSYCLDTGW